MVAYFHVIAHNRAVCGSNAERHGGALHVQRAVRNEYGGGSELLIGMKDSRLGTIL